MTVDALLRTTTELPIADIVVGTRLRACGDVEQLKDSMRRLGLLDPITVSATNKLIVGAHRLEAARQLGWETIRAFIVDLSPVEAELFEIDENLTHHPLTALEQGEHLVRRDELLTAHGKRAMAGDNQNRTIDGGDSGVTTPCSTPRLTTTNLAAEVGMSDRAVQYRMQVARDIPKEVRDLIRGTVVSDRMTDLLALARMNSSERLTIAKMIADGRAKTVAAALRPTPRKVNTEATDEDDDVVAIPYEEDAAERLNPFRLDGIAKYKLPNPIMRHRGDRILPREEQTIERVLHFQCSGDVIETGDEGLRKLCKLYAEFMYRTFKAEGWPRPTRAQ